MFLIANPQHLTIPPARSRPPSKRVRVFHQRRDRDRVSVGEPVHRHRQRGEKTFDPAAPGTSTSAGFERGGIHGSPAMFSLQGVACPSTSQCTAADSAGQVVTFDPSTRDAPTQTPRLTPIDASQSLEGVACPSTSQCTAFDNGRELTFDPRSPMVVIRQTIDSAGTVAAVTCPSMSQCTAVDGTGRELTFDPRSHGTVIRRTIDSAASLAAVTCPSTSQCTAVDGMAVR